MPISRLTLQHLTLAATIDLLPILQWDASITGTGPSQPPNILLDFIYGVAAFLHWGQHDMIKHHFNIHHQLISDVQDRAQRPEPAQAVMMGSCHLWLRPQIDY